MRTPIAAASVARLVAVMFAAPLVAQALPTHIFGTSSSGSTGSGSTSPVMLAPTTASPTSSSGSSSSSTSSTVIAPTNTTQTDQRGASTNEAVQTERASGNTSASQIQAANTPAPAATVSPTSGTTTSGGSSVGTTGGTTTGGTTSGGTTGVVVGSLGFPGSVGAVVNTGEPAVDVNGNIVAGNAAYLGTPAVTQFAAYSAPQYAAAEVAFADNTMNQVIGDAKRDRHRVGRNGQLLYSIAPRTNVDRSREVPDDGPSPALVGPLAR